MAILTELQKKHLKEGSLVKSCSLSAAIRNNRHLLLRLRFLLLAIKSLRHGHSARVKCEKAKESWRMIIGWLLRDVKFAVLYDCLRVSALLPIVHPLGCEVLVYSPKAEWQIVSHGESNDDKNAAFNRLHTWKLSCCSLVLRRKARLIILLFSLFRLEGNSSNFEC